jgi:hypothetical protein
MGRAQGRWPTRAPMCTASVPSRSSVSSPPPASPSVKSAFRWSPAVSRVLCSRLLPCASGGHSSGPPVAGRLKRPTQDLMSTRATPAGCPAIHFRSCSRWGLPCPSCHQESGVLLPHRFTLTGSAVAHAPAVYFLLHCPSSHLDWPLASTLPNGARTFLDGRTTPSRPPFELQRKAERV